MNRRTSVGSKRALIVLGVVAFGIVLGVVLSLVMLNALTGGKDDSLAVKSSPASSGSVSAYVPPQTSSAPMVADSQPVAPSVAEESSSASASASSEPEKQPPPGFKESPSVNVSGGSASVTFKTDAPSTVNAIVTTSGDGVSVAQFYDYFNRGAALNGAVSKQATYKVDENGASQTYEIPDTTKNYYLLVNAVENESGTWQNTVTVIPLYTAGGGVSSSSSSPSQAA